MKILLLIDALDMGGAESHVVTLAEALRAQGNDVSVISAGGTLEHGLAHAGVASLRFPSPVVGRRSVPGMWGNLLFLKRLVRQQHFDVLHAHTRRTALLLRLLRWLELLHPPAVRRQAPYRQSAMRRLSAPVTVVTAHAKFKPRHRLLSFWGDETIAVSDDLKVHTSAVFGVPPERVCVIPNGIDATRFRPTERRKNADTLRVAFASRLDDDCSAAAYALLSLAPKWQALAHARGLALQITLIGGGTQAAEIAELASAMPCVAAIGACEHMENELQNTDLFIGVSRVALEAAFSGCAVILAGNEGAGGLLSAENLDIWAAENFCCRSRGDAPLCRVLTEAFVSYLDRTPAERRALVEDVRTRLLGRYSAARMGADTVALYRKLLTRQRQLTVLIGGYAGCGNLGDDAILRALVNRLQDKRAPRTLVGGAPPLGIDCATVRVEALVGSQGSFANVPCHDRRRPLSPVRRADAFLLGGGALLQNCSEHGNRSLAYYLALAMLARLLGCPWYIVAGGIGPIRGRLPRLWTGFVVRTARDISVRDTPSRDLLCSLGILSRRIRCEQDPVCTVTPISRDKVSSLLRRCSIPDENGTILCVAPHGRMNGVEAMIELIRQRKREGAFPLFFAFDPNEDLMLCRRLQALCGGAVFPTEGLADEKDLPEACIAGVFEQSRAVFTGRLHALILAHIANTPTTIFPPDTGDKKITAFANGDR